MKFVHLTSQSNVDAVRRSGIRAGGGRRGRGVYAVPLFKISRTVPAFEDVATWKIGLPLVSHPLTSGTMWRWLFRLPGRAQRRPFAVVFRAPRRCWPIDVYLQIVMDARFRRRLEDALGDDLVMTSEDLGRVRGAAEPGTFCDFVVSATTPAALGRLLHLYVGHVQSIWARYDESLEVVFRAPIPPSAIERVVPLSQTARKARKRAAARGARAVPE